ncbi:hypothetical protein [Pontibacter liquoris]|uniref:hypothetical protein n=1 Tax=Pontibacter liquoris TaxID=2905677 RepID=UPI001FA7CF53|nr:hypothetical protein [Pontibacter liquoris]
MKKLYRPVGLKELELILNSDSKRFPPRLSWQPIFYPVLNFDYAAQICYQWNVVDDNSGFSGFVTEFSLDESYLEKFEEQVVGGDMHRELWVPSEELEEFNDRIIGGIQITAAFYGEKYVGNIESSGRFKTMPATQQLLAVKTDWEKGNLDSLVKEESVAVQANFSYWKSLPQSGQLESLFKAIEKE